MKKATLILLTACLLLPMGQLTAKPTCPGHKSCGGSGDPPLLVTEVNNTAEYSGFIFEDATAPDAPDFNLDELPVECFVGVVQSNKGVVHYECESGGLISINFSGWHLVGDTGEQGYCDLLDIANGFPQKFREFTPTRRWYRNDSECDRGPGGVCEIRISQISYRGQMNGGGHTGNTHQYFDLDEEYGLGDVGRINIRTWAQLVPLEGEGNVFAIDHAMDLQYIAVDFKAAGKNKTIATCRVDQGDDNWPEEARLNTTVLP